MLPRYEIVELMARAAWERASEDVDLWLELPQSSRDELLASQEAALDALESAVPSVAITLR